MKRIDLTALFTAGMITAGVACGFAASDYDDYRRALEYYNSPEYANQSVMLSYAETKSQDFIANETVADGQEAQKQEFEKYRREQEEHEQKVKGLLIALGYGDVFEKKERPIDIYAGGNIQNASLSALPQQGQEQPSVAR